MRGKIMWGWMAEAVLWLFLEVLAEVGLQSLEVSGGRPLPLWVRLTGYALLGAGLGMLSLLWWPAGGWGRITSRTVALVLAPLLAAWLLVRWVRRDDTDEQGRGVTDKVLRALALLLGLAAMRALAH